MTKLLILADDFTGALDTGVQFAVRGARTCVVTDPAYDFAHAEEGVQVLVMDAETRHLTAGEAYGVVFRAVKRALDAGFTHIYKKTDSALRGNIGAELTAVLDAARLTDAQRQALLRAAGPDTSVTDEAGRLTLTCRGVSAHAAFPAQGRSALALCARQLPGRL